MNTLLLLPLLHFLLNFLLQNLFIGNIIIMLRTKKFIQYPNLLRIIPKNYNPTRQKHQKHRIKTPKNRKKHTRIIILRRKIKKHLINSILIQHTSKLVFHIILIHPIMTLPPFLLLKFHPLTMPSRKLNLKISQFKLPILIPLTTISLILMAIQVIPLQKILQTTRIPSKTALIMFAALTSIPNLRFPIISQKLHFQNRIFFNLAPF